MDLRALLMGLAFAVMWASAFTSTRMIVTEAPPLMALALRFALSGVIGVLIALAIGQTWRNLTRVQWRAVLILGLCQNALYLGLNWIGMQWIEASAAFVAAVSSEISGWMAVSTPRHAAEYADAAARKATSSAFDQAFSAFRTSS